MEMVDGLNYNAAIAQPVERSHGKGEVTGSIPVRGYFYTFYSLNNIKNIPALPDSTEIIIYQNGLFTV